MALALNAATPARATASATTVSTASFTPPAGALLVVCTSADGGTQADPTIAITNSGTALTWSLAARASRTSTGGTTSTNGVSAIHYAQVGSSAAMTVTATQTNGASPTSVKVYVITGHDPTTPVHGGVTGNSQANTLTTDSTPIGGGSWLMVAASEWTANGGSAPTSSDLTWDGYISGTSLSGGSGYRAVSSAANSTATIDKAGTAAADWTWAEVEIEPSPIVKQTFARFATSANTAVTFTSSAGNALLAFISRNGGTASGAITSVTDSTGNAWSMIARGSVSGISNTRTEVWMTNTGNARTSGTVTFNSSTSQTTGVNIVELLNTGWALNVASATDAGSASSTTVATPAVTPTKPATLVFAGFHGSAGTISTRPAAPWQALNDYSDLTTTPAAAVWKDTLAAASQSASWTLSTSARAGYFTFALTPPPAAATVVPASADLTASSTLTADSGSGGGGGGTGNIVLTPGTSTEGTASATSTTVSLPSMVAGDYCLMVVSLNVSSGNVTTPNGWTDILPSATSANGSTSDNLAVFYRKYVPGDSGTVAITTASGRVAATPIRVQGADPSSFLAETSGPAQLPSGSTTLTAPSITPSTSTVLWVVNGRNASNGNVLTPFDSFTQPFLAEASAKSTATNAGHAIMATTTATPGAASGTGSANPNVSTTGAIAVTFSLTPAPAAVTVVDGAADLTASSSLLVGGATTRNAGTTLTARSTLTAAAVPARAARATLTASSTLTTAAALPIIANPERGLFQYTETHYRSDLSGHVPLDAVALAAERVSKGRTLVFRYFVMERYVTAPWVEQAYLDLLTADFAAARAAGVKLVVRFTYSTSGNMTPPYLADPAPAKVMDHVFALAPVVAANADVVAAVEAGFIGMWGEWYYTDNFGDQGTLTAQQWTDRTNVVWALLDQLGSIPVLVRYPGIKRHMFGDPATDPRAARVGFHNDALLADFEDFGTYTTFTDGASAATIRNYVLTQPSPVWQGGESAAVNGTHSLWPDAQAELSAYRWTFLNPIYHPDVIASWGANLDTAAQYLGYRLRWTARTVPASSTTAGTLDVSVTLANEGWQAPLTSRPVQIVFTDGTHTYRRALTADPRTWLPGGSYVITGTVAAPDVPGTYSVHLAMPDPATGLAGRPEYAVQLANAGTWQAADGWSSLNATTTITGAAVAAGANLSATSSLTLAGTASRTAGATLTASSTLTAGAVPARVAAAALVVNASLTTAAVPARAAAAALTSSSTLTAAAVPSRVAGAQLTASSSLTADATTTRIAAASLTSSSTLTTTATQTGVATGAAALTASSTTTAAGTAAGFAGLALTASSTVTLQGTAGRTTGGTLTASSSLSVAGTAARTAAAALTGSSSLAADATLTRLAALQLAASSSLTTTAGATGLTSSALTASSTLTADAGRTALATLTLTASSTLAAAGVPARAAIAVLAASSTLTAGAGRTLLASAVLAAASSLTAAGGVTGSTGADLSAASTLTAAGGRTLPAAVALAGSSTLTTTGIAGTSLLLDLAASSALTVAGIAVRAATLTLTSTSTLTAAGTATRTAAAALTAGSSLTAGGTRALPAAVALSAGSSLTLAAIAGTTLQLDLTAGSTLSTAAKRTVPAQLDLTADSSLTTGGTRTTGAQAALTAGSTTTAGLQVTIRAAVATLTASGTLTTTGRRTAAVSAELDSSSTLTAVATLTRAAYAELTASSSLTLQETRTTSSSAPLVAYAELDMDGVVVKTATVRLEAVSELTTIGAVNLIVRNVNATVTGPLTRKLTASGPYARYLATTGPSTRTLTVAGPYPADVRMHSEQRDLTTTGPKERRTS